MAQSPTILQALSRRSTFIFLAGAFCVFGAVGIAADVSNMGRTPLRQFLLAVLICGAFPTLYVVMGFSLKTRARRIAAIFPVFLVQLFLMRELFRGSSAQITQLDASALAVLQNRLGLDAGLTMLAIAVGYACFGYVIGREGKRYFRVQAEIDLAKEIHQVLVPAIDAKLGEYEFYGCSVASGEVGGDLIDVAGNEENWVAYLADVSGHGVAPGVVMGMVKSASRMLLTSGESAERLMPRVNEVIFPLKKPDMFVTFCFVAKSGENVRVGLAGHPAILHFSAATNSVSQIECPNMPLGIIPEGEFIYSEIPTGHGDVFLLYTDGFVEPANSAGEEYGIARLQGEFQKHAAQPLDAIYKALQESVARFGAQFDDQSLLLIRKV